MRRPLEALHSQAVATASEILVAVHDPIAIAPEAERLYPAVTWLQGKRDDSIFRLRALALPHCRAQIIALTEDHAWVAPDWCQTILEAHERYPDAAAIGGVVENGATASIPDWAGFFVTNGRFMGPIRNGASDDIALQANVSYLRRALPQSLPEYGIVQSIFHKQLRERGEKLIAHDRMVVYHTQDLTLRGHSAAHFHNARSTAALLRVAAPDDPWLAGYAVLVPKMIFTTVATVIRKRRHRRELLMAVPIIAWLVCCHAAGELIGHFAGPGRSPTQVN